MARGWTWRWRFGSEDDAIKVAKHTRMELTMSVSRLMSETSNLCKDQAGWPPPALTFESRLTGIGLARLLSCTTLDRMQMASSNSHGCEALFAITFPRMSSAKICSTRAVKHGFSKSSVGRRMDRTAWERS